MKNCITIYCQSCEITTRASLTTVLKIVLLRSSGIINTKLLHRNRVSNFVGTLQLSDGAYSYTTNRLKHTNCLEKQEYYISLPREPSEIIPMHCHELLMGVVLCDYYYYYWIESHVRI